MLRRILLWILLLAPLALGGLYWNGAWRPPPAWDPAAPLDFRAPPNLLTGWKLARMDWQPESCFAAFAASGRAVARVPDRPSETGCAIENALRLEGESVEFGPNRPIVTCPMAAAWAMFERHSLQPAAEAHFGSRVATVRHLGSYNCRNVYHRAAGRRSQHATANALDVAGFTLADGRSVALPRDWGEAGENARADFLRAARDGACRWFKAVLGPDYNAAHRDHFHLDRGMWSRCS
ncbi:extensin family protein [Pseudoroseomonas cervicalis]|uniref:extensin family protein n=1 Tax=Teichococcus cervicalis TaxID=204525 RepID=UPI00278BA4F2|nr:extensin family protein [Pseudoroseomonas cervicalis]MDQ1079766.1 hypothetical protein [Pseudoroseomonas cervicalis]